MPMTPHAIASPAFPFVSDSSCPPWCVEGGPRGVSIVPCPQPPPRPYLAKIIFLLCHNHRTRHDRQRPNQLHHLVHNVYRGDTCRISNNVPWCQAHTRVSKLGGEVESRAEPTEVAGMAPLVCWSAVGATKRVEMWTYTAMPHCHKAEVVWARR